MSLTARSADMEHFRSTLATAGIAAFGLLAAAHILHPGNFERTTYPSRPVATVVPHASAWVTPPETLAASGPASPVTIAAPAGKPGRVPIAWTSVMAPLRSSEATAVPEPRRKVALARRHKAASRQARLRQAEPTGPVARSAGAEPAPKPQATRSDPIGDLIRGLGFGSDS